MESAGWMEGKMVESWVPKEGGAGGERK